MKSAGNDIVALKGIDIQRTISPAFYSKFITVAEHALYQQLQLRTVPFQSFVWLLWSVKESVYKYLKRHQSGLVFAPAKIIIQNIAVPWASPQLKSTDWQNGPNHEEFYTGEVISGTHRLYFRSKITDEFIASVVSAGSGFENVYWGVRSVAQADNENQSRLVREFILEKLKQVLNTDDLRIEKTGAGYPVVLQDKKQLDIPVSLAHHGCFVAYSFCKQANY